MSREGTAPQPLCRACPAACCQTARLGHPLAQQQAHLSSVLGLTSHWHQAGLRRREKLACAGKPLPKEGR